MVNFRDDPEYLSQLSQLEDQYSLPKGILPTIATIESNWNPKAVSKAGAQGMFQFMPATWGQYGGGGDPTDPYAAAKAAAAFSADNYKKFGGDITKTVAAYNAGAGNVQKYGGVPPFAETQNYVNKFNKEFGNWGQQTPGLPAQMPQMQAPQGTAQTEEKKGGLLGKILPNIFRFALPMAAGAVIGGNSGGAFSPLSGALLGATGGGFGYLNEEAAKKKAAEKLAAEKMKLAPQIFTATTNANYKQGMLDNALAQTDIKRKNGESLDNYRKRVAAAMEKNAKTNEEKAKDKGSKADKSTDPFGKFLEDMAKQFGNKPINPNNVAEKEAFKVYMQQAAPNQIETDPNFFGFGGGEVDDSKLQQMIEVYNQRLGNLGGGAQTNQTSAPPILNRKVKWDPIQGKVVDVTE